MKLTSLGDIAARYGVQTPVKFWRDVYSEIEFIAEYDGDWEQMVEERIAGLTELKARYYEIVAQMPSGTNEGP